MSLKLKEESVEILDGDEILLLIESSDITNNHITNLDEIVTDGDEFLGDDKLQLLEE